MVIDYVECNGEILVVVRLIDEFGKVCCFVGKGNYKVVVVKLKRNELCFIREEFLKKVEECRK